MQGPWGVYIVKNEVTAFLLFMSRVWIPLFFSRVLKNVVNGFWRPKQYFTIAKQWPTGINKYFHRCIITRSAELNELNRGNRAGLNLAIKHKSIELASYRQMTTTSTPSTGFSRVRMDSSTQECMTSAPPRFDRTEHGPVQGLSRGQISNRFVDLSLVNQCQEFEK